MGQNNPHWDRVVLGVLYRPWGPLVPAVPLHLLALLAQLDLLVLGVPATPEARFGSKRPQFDPADK